MDARSGMAAGGSLGHVPDPGRPGTSTPPRGDDKEVFTVAIAEDLAIIHDRGWRTLHGRAAWDRLHPPQRALGSAEGHLRHVGRRLVPVEYFLYGAILMTFGFTLGPSAASMVC